MHGILIIDKPEGITSHDVVNRVRRVLGTKKVGHTGTLDPFATGVLVILVGKATRLAQFIDKDEKEYAARIKFGFRTDTGDRTGTRLGDNEKGRQEEANAGDIAAVLSRFRGDIEQIPPMYSAKKVAGKKLYELARKGETVERKPVKVSITKLEIVSPSDVGVNEMDIVVRCSAGTYIRTLAEDIGDAVGIGAHLTALRRTHAGRFSLDRAVMLDELERGEFSDSQLLPISEAVEHLPELRLAEDRVAKTINGMSTRVADTVWKSGEMIKMLSPCGDIIAIGIFDDSENSIRPKVVLG